MAQVSIELPDLKGESFYEDVVQAAAEKMLWSKDTDEDGEEFPVPTDLRRKIQDAVTAEVREQAAAATPGIVQQILDGEVIKRDRWGDATGKRTTVKDVVAEEIARSLNNRGRDSLDEMIKRAVEHEFKTQLQQLIDAASQPILDAVRAEASAVFTRAAEKAVQV